MSDDLEQIQWYLREYLWPLQTQSIVDFMPRATESMLPGLAGSNITQWMGHRPCMPDSLPVIGLSSRFANVYFAFGHGHVWLCGGAPTGRIIADLVAGRTRNIDIAPFRRTGFRISLGPGMANSGPSICRMGSGSYARPHN